MAEAILNQPHFQDEDKAREYLRRRVGPKALCARTAAVSANTTSSMGSAPPWPLQVRGLPAKQFTVTVGTVFESSKIKLHIWLQAVHLMTASKKGISSKQLERMLGVTYKTAWFMSHRIREAMNIAPKAQLGLSAPVEVDETYWGNVGKHAAGRSRLPPQDEGRHAGRARRREAFVPSAQRQPQNLRPIMKGMIAKKAR